MVSNIGSIGQFDPEALFEQQKPLSEEQKTGAQELLAQYDPENLSEDDIQSIHQGMKELGIRPGKEQKSLIEDAGFDAEALRPQGPPPGGGQGGPMIGMQNVDGESLDTLKSILDKYDFSNYGDTEKEQLLTELGDAGLLTGNSTFLLKA